eukprot:2306135-Rhodomonas_salina.2
MMNFRKAKETLFGMQFVSRVAYQHLRTHSAQIPVFSCAAEDFDRTVSWVQVLTDGMKSNNGNPMRSLYAQVIQLR